MSDFQLSPDEKAKALQNFHNEADLLAQLKHPNLPKVSDVFEEGDKAYLVMEFIEGKTLAKIQEEQNGPLDEHLVMSWALKLCAVLDYLHTRPQPIIFRDMKPTNVMVMADGEIKLIDFGIARIFKTAVTKDTTLLGSHGYAPLEQYGRGQSDARSDIYALGATLYELLTKEVPIDAPSRRTNSELFSHPRQLNPNISPEVEAIVLKAMAEEPQDRYQTAAKLYSAIFATGLASTSNIRLPTSGPFAALPTSEPASGPTNYPTTPPLLVSPQENTMPGTSQQLSELVVSPPNTPVSPPQLPKGPIRSTWGRFPLWGKIVAVTVILGLVLLSTIVSVFNIISPPPLTTLCLATNLPESGTRAAEGRAIRHGVEAALKQSSLFTATYHGYHLTELVMDDSPGGGDPDPVQGAQNLTNLFHAASCPNPIAVIGPYNTGVAQKEIPVAAKNHLLLLSSSNTMPCLTKEAFSTPDCPYDQIHPQGFPNTYARLPGTDIDRGYMSADFLVNAPDSTDPGQRGLGASRVEIVVDENIAQVAQVLIQALGRKGITPVGVDCFKPTDAYNKDHFCSQLDSSIEAFSVDNMMALATKIRDEHPDAVFFSGIDLQGAGLLLKDLRGLGLDQVSFVGTGGVFVGEASTFFGTIGSYAANTYAIVAGADPSTFTSGPQATFSHQYQSQFGKLPEPLSAGGYDATNIIIQVIKDLIDSGKPVTKESVVQAVLSGTFTGGVTSNYIQFDQNGDNIGQRVYTIYQSQLQSQTTWNWKVLAERQTG